MVNCLLIHQCYLSLAQSWNLTLAVYKIRKTVYLIWLNIFRWEEVLCKCSTGLVPLMKKLIERMPDVVVVGDERSITLLRYTQCGLHVSRKCF